VHESRDTCALVVLD